MSWTVQQDDRGSGPGVAASSVASPAAGTSAAPPVAIGAAAAPEGVVVASSSATGAANDTNLDELLQKVVDDTVDDDEPATTTAASQRTAGTPSAIPASGSQHPSGAVSGGVGASAGAAGTGGVPVSGGGGLYTKSSQVFSPVPLTPGDLQATPVKDPLESFNSWVRTQTPTSHRNSPTPTGGLYVGPGGAVGPNSPQNAQRGGAGVSASSAAPSALQANPLYTNGTPQKFTIGSDLYMTSPSGGGMSGSGQTGLLHLGRAPGGSVTSSGGAAMVPPSAVMGGGAGGGGASSRPPAQLDAILEHRKQLLLQMEELAMQEMELRNQHGLPISAPPGGYNNAFPEWSPSSNMNSMHPSPYHMQHGGGGGAGGQHSMGGHLNGGPGAMGMHGGMGGIGPRGGMVGGVPGQHGIAGDNGMGATMGGAFTNGITADNIRGRVYETAKDQHGCRFLQRWLDANYDGEAVQVIMTEIIPHVAELMTDQYANFLVQKLFDIMPHDVRYNVAQVAAPHIAHIALTPHGTFSVQKLIETIATREEMEIIRESLSHDVVRLVKDVHGNHVIQKVLQRFEHPDKEFIYDAVSNDCAAIATNKQGCCVLQRCLEFASPAQHKALVACILQCCLQIVQDPFGNYVLQYVLEANDPAVNDTIAKAFLPCLVPLCMNKFSSNVMEKVLRGVTAPVRDLYMDTMRNPDIIASLMQDDFGNYVLQTALTIGTPAQSEILVSVIRPLMPMIKNAPYAKKLEAKMELIMKKKTLHNGNSSGGVSGGSGGSAISSGGGHAPHHHAHHHHHRGGPPLSHFAGGAPPSGGAQGGYAVSGGPQPSQPAPPAPPPSEGPVAMSGGRGGNGTFTGGHHNHHNHRDRGGYRHHNHNQQQQQHHGNGGWMAEGRDR